MANPLIALGTLNRLKAAVYWNTFPTLNVTASYLGTEGIRLALDGNAVTFIPAMAGAVTSPEPYQVITLSINLLKTQGLADLYKQQMEANSLLGVGNVYPDVASGGIGVYQITNCAIESIRELSFAGTDASYNVNIRGYYNINSSLWD